jgi:plasmid stabilization system protein ParE
MSRYRLAEQARADLDEIWLYIAEDNIPAQTVSLIPSTRGLFS